MHCFMSVHESMFVAVDMHSRVAFWALFGVHDYLSSLPFNHSEVQYVTTGVQEPNMVTKLTLALRRTKISLRLAMTFTEYTQALGVYAEFAAHVRTWHVQRASKVKLVLMKKCRGAQ